MNRSGGNSPRLLAPSLVLSHAVAQHGTEMRREAKCHLLVFSGDDRQPQGGHPFPLQHCQQLQHDRGAPETAHEGEEVLAQASWHPAGMGRGTLLGFPCWLEELASGASGSGIDPASCLHLLDGRKVTNNPACPPVPLPGFCGGHNGEHNARCYPHPVFSDL